MKFHQRDMESVAMPSGEIDPIGLPPIPLRVLSILQQIFSIMLLTYCIHSRWPTWKAIKSQPFISWINVVLYIDSLLFTMAQMVTRYAFGLNLSFQACQSAVMFCLSFYLSTKLLIYFYFTERSFLVWRSRSEKRSRNFFYVFNMTVIIGGYLAVIVCTYLFRINDFSISGQCRIGVQRRAGIPLATYETCINIYLTCLFLFPLRNVYTYKNRNNARLRRMAIRCMIGTSITTLSTGVNLATVVALNGEQAWLCLMLCNLDVVICVVVLHWITSYGKSRKLEPRASQTVVSRNTLDRTGTSRIGEPQSSWKDPLVTTSITYDREALGSDLPSPHGISVYREHSRRVETIGPQDEEGSTAPPVLQSDGKSSDGDSLEMALERKAPVVRVKGRTEGMTSPRRKNLARLSLPDVRGRDDILPVHLEDLKDLEKTPTSNATSSSRNDLSRHGSILDVSKEEKG